MSTHSWQPHGVRLPVVRTRRFTRWVGLLLCAVLAALVAGAALGQGPARSASEPTSGTFGELPLAFVPNAGQTDPRVRFSAHAGGVSFYFTEQEAVLAFARDDEGLALRLAFLGANPAPEIEGRRARQGTVNYLLGSDSSTWQAGIPTFGEVVYRDLWPGIDMVFRGANGKLKYEFVARPGADPSAIRLAYRGADGLALSSAGELLIQTPWGTLRDEKPRTFQVADGRRVPVESRFALGETAGSYGFALDAYDSSSPLVIDPGLLYSTYLGGSGHEEASNLVQGADGSAYVTGFTRSADFPTTAGAFDSSLNSDDVFLTKLDATGALVYSTYLGGAGPDSGSGIDVDSAGNAYVAGSTSSADFPTTAGALDTTFAGSPAASDAFVAKLSANGSTLVYSTYLGGENGEGASDVAVDAAGSAYVVGAAREAGFPTTPGAFDETVNGFNDGFVAKLDPAGSALVYSTYLGGFECDFEAAAAVEVDSAGNAFVAGYASSSDFPTTPGAFDTTPEGCLDLNNDAYVTKLNPTGSALIYSTMLDGASGLRDFALGIAIDDAGRAFVTGATASPGFPTTLGAFDQTFGGNVDAFVTGVNASGSGLVFSTFLGGFGGDDGTAVALDSAGDVFVVGLTNSPDFPVTPGSFDGSVNDSEDAFLVRLDPLGSDVLYGTYFGGGGAPSAADAALFGLGVDDSGNALFGGYTESATFPTSPGAFDTTYGGSTDGWVAKLATEAPSPSATERIGEAISTLEGLTTPQNADKLEDVVEKLDKALAKLALSPPDRQGAAGELEGAVGDVEAAVRSGLLSSADGDAVMTEIAEAAGLLAEDAIAEAQGGNAAKLAEAQAALAAGNSRLAAGRFKAAVALYKDAISKAEGA